MEEENEREREASRGRSQDEVVLIPLVDFVWAEPKNT
jgi:hypothetical protein